MTNETLRAICHDLRSPLTAIGGTFEILDEVWPPEAGGQGKRVLAAGQRALGQLERLVEQMHDWALVAAGESVSARVPCTVSTLLTRAQQVIRSSRPAEVRFEPSDPLAELCVEPERASRALALLLERAEASTPAGQVVTLASAREADLVRLRIACPQDPLPGDRLEALFQPFEPASSLAGPGLGAARLAARLHGGNAWAEACPEGGLTLFLALPAADSAAP